MATLELLRRCLAVFCLCLTFTVAASAQRQMTLGPAQVVAPPVQQPAQQTAPPATAVTNAPAAAPNTASSDAAAPFAVEKRAENAELLRVAQRRLEAAGPDNSAAVQEVAVYQSLDSVLAQQEVVQQQIKEFTTRHTELETAAQAAKIDPAQNSTLPTFADLDRLKDEMATEEARARLVEDKLTTTKASLETAQQAFNDSERVRRQAEEAAEANKDQPNAAQTAGAMEQARQAAKLAGETLALRKLQLTRDELARNVQKSAVAVYENRIAHISPLVIFSQADYDAQLATIKKKEDDTKATINKTLPLLQAAEVQLRDAQRQLESEAGDRAVLTEKVEALRRTQERLSNEIDSLTQKLQRQSQLRVAWDRRFKMPSPQAAATDKETWTQLKAWYKEVKADLASLEGITRNQILSMRDARNLISTVSKKAEGAKDGPPELVGWIDRQQRELDSMLRTFEANLVSMESTRRVNEKLRDEIYDTLPDVSPKNLAWDAWEQVQNVWSKELGAIDDKAITVGKVIACLVVFVFGLMLSRILSAVFANRILKRLKLSKDGTAVVRSLVFYGLLAAVAVCVLQILNVPLTAFTIFGGAIAIGVGFGSQALINNFVGGLIMLAERPVRLGERIIFGNFDGVVEDVGFRCTKLRTSSDHLITIPNSTLVNDSIENTARRRTIRRLLNITISYETPRDRIALAVQVIRDILEEKGIRERIHPIVGFEELRPRVHFSDFNADSLNIQVVYWYAPPESWAYMEHSERVNHRIMEEFERIGVNFAFPSKNMVLVNDTGPRLGRSNVA